MSLRRPLGVSAGVVGLVLAWLGGVAIVQLTGAVAVLIVLAATSVGAAIAAVVGWWSLGSIRIGAPSAPALVERDASFPIELPIASRRRVWVELRRGTEVIASGWTDDDRFVGTAATERRGDRSDRGASPGHRSAGTVVVGSDERDRHRSDRGRRAGQRRTCGRPTVESVRRR
ncbi:MAG: hypothetical protein R2697_05940 [Ilumatobacteraceae bacterium]